MKMYCFLNHVVREVNKGVLVNFAFPRDLFIFVTDYCFHLIDCDAGVWNYFVWDLIKVS